MSSKVTNDKTQKLEDWKEVKGVNLKKVHSVVYKMEELYRM